MWDRQGTENCPYSCGLPCASQETRYCRLRSDVRIFHFFATHRNKMIAPKVRYRFRILEIVSSRAEENLDRISDQHFWLFYLNELRGRWVFVYSLLFTANLVWDIRAKPTTTENEKEIYFLFLFQAIKKYAKKIFLTLRPTHNFFILSSYRTDGEFKKETPQNL